MRTRRLGQLATILVLAGLSRVWAQTPPPEQQEGPPASQSQPATRPTVPEGRTSAEELRSRLKAAEAAPDLAEDVRARIVGLYQEAQLDRAGGDAEDQGGEIRRGHEGGAASPGSDPGRAGKSGARDAIRSRSGC